ncbi:MAG TPA: hypothetical protein VFD58_24675 [Blastocatellia bacterium]|nr:hypothetical protein [Blastocatellia bacterium]
MALRTRENPETKRLEVFTGDGWVDFDEYRERQIAEAYDNSIKFLRDRLGEDYAADEARPPAERPGEKR